MKEAIQCCSGPHHGPNPTVKTDYICMHFTAEEVLAQQGLRKGAVTCQRFCVTSRAVLSAYLRVDFWGRQERGLTSGDDKKGGLVDFWHVVYQHRPVPAYTHV